MTSRLAPLRLQWSDHLMSNDLTQCEDPTHFSTSKPEPKWKSEAQFAMESSCFCVICGSPFDLEGEVYNLDTGAERYKWMRNYRLIGSRRDIHYHNLAGLSEEDFHSACFNTSNCNDVFLSARATWNEGNDQLFNIDGLYLDTNIPYTLKFNAMQQLGDHDTVFPLHEDCLKISRRAIKHLIPTTLGSRPSASCLSILNSILQSRFRDNAKSTKPSDLVARNDLFDLCTATDLNGPRSVVGLSLLEWWASDYEKFYTDPTNVPNISTCVLQLLQDTRAVDTCPSPRPLSSQELSAIERLPTELLDQTIAYISAYEAFSLHCASKTLARKLPLDNNSWRENILSGNGLPYLWDLDIEWLNKQHQKHSAKSKGADAAWNWKAVGQLLATKHFPLKSPDPRIDDLPNGLWNRRRIWSIVEQATRRDFSKVLNKEPIKSILEPRKRREPVFDWQLEEIMDDLGHYS